jgi:hypothetical protein
MAGDEVGVDVDAGAVNVDRGNGAVNAAEKVTSAVNAGEGR